MILIRQIEAEDTFSVRQPILRPGKPIESCHFEGDNLGTTAHFGLSENEELLAVVSLFKKNYPNCSIENQFQMRGMAVLENYQRMGFGEQLVKKAEHFVKEKNGKLIWFNAREIAVPFYERLGYKIYGNPFEITEIGKHFVMYKRL
ncbi:acetyltransferase [Flavobacterium enshiense DK69]|uniref:Acetyltransferase n=1 Tax=Flavobacterium enshiense DK69 TaxID=1107311 RepID=V6SFU7_9FLAO|nr:GNAT family N-acetyltransferase [Flavobacterium enshiense]ESU23280.1 acetyltransferase [Flavobacterium enshiense DK69]KGO96490.1 acetyltransferase [Flavobacterium enshiense DK69]